MYLLLNKISRKKIPARTLNYKNSIYNKLGNLPLLLNSIVPIVSETFPLYFFTAPTE